jgi:hypothetical protein
VRFQESPAATALARAPSTKNNGGARSRGKDGPRRGTPSRWRASLGSSVCALWTDPREERLASPPPWWRQLRTCPRVGPPSTGTPKARATATVHGVFFPTGTVIAAGKGRRLPLSVYWRNSAAPESGGASHAGTRVCARGHGANASLLARTGGPRYRTPREITRFVVCLPREIPFPAGSFRAVGAGITVPDGKFCRSVREIIAFSWGSITVPVGNEYRSLREVLPYPWGMDTVPVGNFVGGFSCKRTKTRRRWRCACLC